MKKQKLWAILLAGTLVLLMFTACTTVRPSEQVLDQVQTVWLSAVNASRANADPALPALKNDEGLAKQAAELLQRIDPGTLTIDQKGYIRRIALTQNGVSTSTIIQVRTKMQRTENGQFEMQPSPITESDLTNMSVPGGKSAPKNWTAAGVATRTIGDKIFIAYGYTMPA